MLWFGLALILGWFCCLFNKALALDDDTERSSSSAYRKSLCIAAILCFVAVASFFLYGVGQVIELQFWY